MHEILKQRYPEMAFDPVPDPLTGLKKVSFGMADAMVINVALASHLMEKAGISNLHMAGTVASSTLATPARANSLQSRS